MNDKTIQDLGILEKYLTEDELKDIAKKVAYDTFIKNLGIENPYAKSNAEFYIQHGAYQAVIQHACENQIDIKELSVDLEKRVKSLIRSTDRYHLPTTFNDLTTQIINEKCKPDIENKLNELLKDFIEKESFSSIYTTFESYIGNTLGEMMYDIVTKHFNKKE